MLLDLGQGEVGDLQGFSWTFVDSLSDPLTVFEGSGRFRGFARIFQKNGFLRTNFGFRTKIL